MIPLKLQLKNFLSYGQALQTINFEPYHLICFSGKNGHGKSALLDAMTWALWGQARKTSGITKPDFQLLRLGQTHMIVIFDFILNGQTYRIRREYSETYNRPYAALDFALVNPENNNLISLTDKTIRQTQEKIEMILGLDFDSFVNSAFLRQGLANEFSKKSPKERKEILANILNLQQYENVRKLSAEKAKQLQLDSQIIEQISQRIHHELTASQDTVPQLQLLVDELQILETAMHTHKQELEQYTEQQKNYVQLIQEQKILKLQVDQIMNQFREQSELVTAQFSVWRSINKQFKNIPLIEALEEEKKTIIQQVALIQQTIQHSLTVKDELFRLKQEELAINNQLSSDFAKSMQLEIIIKERLEYEYNFCKQILKELNQKQLIAFDQHGALKQQVVTYPEQTSTNEQEIEKQFEKRKAYYQVWVTRLQTINTELEALEQKKQVVHNHNNPCCPLCEQNLSASRKRFLKIKFIAQQNTYQNRSHRLSRVLKQLKELLIRQHKDILHMKHEQDQLNQKKIVNQELKKQLALLTQEIQTRAEEINQQNQLLLEYEKKISTQLDATKQKESAFKISHAQHPTLAELRIKIAELQQQLPSDDLHIRYQKLINRISFIDQQYEQYRQLLQEKELQKQRATTIQQLCNQLRKLKLQLIMLNEQLQHVIEKQRACNVEEKLEQKHRLLKQLQERKESLMHEKGKLEQIQQARIVQYKEREEQERKLKSLQESLSDYQNITNILGKDGIQALIIESVLPEIEQEANLLLSELTNNQAQIFIESLRDLKKGGTKETLDIKISDTMGIRPYELFSGGEAFRIDFALRIAMSKLLARRAGTSLQTLIIDEGFGSQDEEGIAHLMDAIHKIQNHFAKVIIVSHLPILKEQFPVHFLIEKGAQGSSVRILEQG